MIFQTIIPVLQHTGDTQCSTLSLEQLLVPLAVVAVQCVLVVILIRVV